jgi:plasmid replication initiation protein
MTLEDFRQMLGVEAEKYPLFGALNKHVVKPVVLEVNALAPFSVSILPVKTGKRVTHIRIGWWSKSKDEIDEAWREVNRSRVGRKARIAGQAAHVTASFPSQNRLVRDARRETRSRRDDAP